MSLQHPETLQLLEDMTLLLVRLNTILLPAISNLRTTSRPVQSLYKEGDTGSQRKIRGWSTKWLNGVRSGTQHLSTPKVLARHRRPHLDL